jgi:hypothetical protein
MDELLSPTTPVTLLLGKKDWDRVQKLVKRLKRTDKSANMSRLVRRWIKRGLEDDAKENI